MSSSRRKGELDGGLEASSSAPAPECDRLLSCRNMLAPHSQATCCSACPWDKCTEKERIGDFNGVNGKA